MADVNSGVRRLGNINEPMVIVGLLLILFFVACLLLQVQTSESFWSSGVIVGLTKPDPQVLMQIWNLMTGSLTPHEVVVVILGWGSEIAYFACIAGHKHFHGAVSRHNGLLAGVCDVIAFLLVALNWWSDYQYGTAVLPGFWGQIAFSVIVSFVVASFGIAGAHFIKVGFGKE